ncbi:MULTISPECIES: hypothetical protein [unclassified Enterococcus]|uniref:hypothetical protein n=1 Tax=unclassified Enterococcus TaxID=2608891 RepID=UPI00155300FD|nr:MULTISPECIES: hypothetical protein [unclassified Enterococcus]MBS7578306.1 hypothetical protein [Enterococcus sp. MMGLQ5-2]MBS7585483.1 hypothetical protein [Enterococcus sp. MMGLQ5-1]NPD13340.1 hypothetical protein [Enterococcus sp. MMGLQ5-1]NPD38137.1 hypothetical protein [Enterococcus sp. MMGLQ5-2]
MVKQSEQEIIKRLVELRESKDIDQIAESILGIISIYGLKLDETAALCYYITDRTVKAEHNAKFIKENLKLDVNTLSVEGVLQMQRALVVLYIDKLKHDTKRKD